MTVKKTILTALALLLTAAQGAWAEDWVRRRMKENEETHGYVNTYELEESAMQALNCLIFPAPTKEWVDFVMQNRTQK